MGRRPGARRKPPGGRTDDADWEESEDDLPGGSRAQCTASDQDGRKQRWEVGFFNPHVFELFINMGS